MKTFWPAATIAIAISGYFAWSSFSAPPARQLQIDDCHRLAGEVEAIHGGGGTISDTHLATARNCSVSFGQNWAAAGGERSAQLRAEGALRVQ